MEVSEVLITVAKLNHITNPILTLTLTLQTLLAHLPYFQHLTCIQYFTHCHTRIPAVTRQLADIPTCRLLTCRLANSQTCQLMDTAANSSFMLTASYHDSVDTLKISKCSIMCVFLFIT